MRMLRQFLFLAAVLILTSPTLNAGETPSDAEIKTKLLGYWQSPRHAYLIEADGVVYMCPRSICTTTNRWDVKNGRFYWDSEPHEILTLDGQNFVYREVGASSEPYKLKRISAREAE